MHEFPAFSLEANGLFMKEIRLSGENLPAIRAQNPEKVCTFRRNKELEKLCHQFWEFYSAASLSCCIPLR